MCLVTIAWQQNGKLPLVVAANRDERFDRPADELGWWVHAPDIIGGRDIEAGGTWLAMHRNGRFGIVTNYREVPGTGQTPRSRGELIVDWLTSNDTHDTFAASVLKRGGDYAGFNLLYGDNDTLAYVSNRSTQPCTLEPGVYALSNGLLDSAWPKVTQARDAMHAALASDDIEPRKLKSFLCDTTQAADEDLPAEDFDIERRRLLSAPFILGDRYGTRCSTVISRSADGLVDLHEQHYAPGGAPTHHIDQQFRISPA
ncbi:MAG: NRDE family protein [Pseudomonadota bacterium]